MVSQSPTAEYQEPIDISKLTSLRKLTVCATFRSEPLDNTFWWLNKFLRACSTPNRLLDSITIQVQYRFYKSKNIDLQHWDDISDALLSDHFPSLKWVHISISSLVHLEHAKKIIEQLQSSKFITTFQSRRDLNVDFTFRYCWWRILFLVFTCVDELFFFFPFGRQSRRLPICTRSTLGKCGSDRRADSRNSLG